MYTEKLIEEYLTEATLDYNTELRKIQDNENGYRPRNWNACSYSKLIYGYSIATGYFTNRYSVYPKTVRDIEAALRYQGYDPATDAGTKQHYNRYHNINQQQANAQSNTKSPVSLSFSENDFQSADAVFVRDNEADPKTVLNREMARSTGTIKQVFIDLIYAIILKLPNSIAAFKNFLLNNAGMSIDEIKDSINQILTNQLLVDRLNDIKNWISAVSSNSNLTNSAATNLDANSLHEEVVEEAVEKHDTLNPKLWNEDNTLKPEVEEKINLIVKDFLDGLAENEIKINVKDVKLVGSNCSYNYNDKSDLDVHIEADTDSLGCPDNLYPLLYSAYRSIWNKNHDVEFYGIPVELFVETSDTKKEDPAEADLKEARQQTALKSNGIYSVMNHKWIKEPVAEDIPEIDQEAFNTLLAEWEEKYNKLLAEINN